MRIRIKDTNGIIKSYHTQRYKTIRRGFLEVLSKELGTKTFQIQIQDYNCGWSDWVSVDLNVIDKETLAIPSLTNTLSPLDLGGSDVLNFNTNNPKIIENLYNENDLTVKLTNTQLSLSGYTQGTYNLKIKNYKSYDDDDDDDELTKNKDIVKSESIYSEALDLNVQIKGPVDNSELRTVELDVNSNTITLSEVTILQKLGTLPENYTVHSIYLRNLNVSSKPKSGGTYIYNPQKESEIIHNNGFICKFFKTTLDDETLSTELVKETLCLNEIETMNFKGNELLVDSDVKLEVQSGNNDPEIDETKIISLTLYVYIAPLLMGT